MAAALSMANLQSSLPSSDSSVKGASLIKTKSSVKYPIATRPSNASLYPIEPAHSSRLTTVQAQEPFNAEPPVEDLVEFNITPEELVYARNHGAVREFSSAEYNITVRLPSGAHRILLPELKERFSMVTVEAAMQCAGNRRSTMAKITGKEVKGVSWDEAVIANCLWGGVRLRDVLVGLGLDENLDDMHVHFASHATECFDDNLPVEEKPHSYYGSSIPVRKALSLEDDVLLAYEMNGEELSPDHGGPLRVVVPGYLAARWVKWLTYITVAPLESDNFYMSRDYRILPPTILSKPQAEAEGAWEKVPAMTVMPISSVIATAYVKGEGKIYVKGYAVPRFDDPAMSCKSLPSETSISLTTDAGKTWYPTTVVYRGGRWGWVIWEGEIPVPKSTKSVEIFSRATAPGDSQPKEAEWNLRGVAWNGWGKAIIEI
ncbi:Oxidoreductase, molybdopterin-binding domain-containing protein [Mycena floridula]|nr:Oxidoreductase, molybdopterin-binding domain-containing protein [Mycena floridula]